ncbi:hypothetical protein B5V03_34090 [Bradyrhizobium betae]|uniref:Uncharacterized protein n=1 Tax=Bradyrhizobium betae TaxID=244734 RepID=A0A4Q1UPT1_9BRAD|nr:hypothetical protein B5V03_34090 [Bradyrhizobium betae]
MQRDRRAISEALQDINSLCYVETAGREQKRCMQGCAQLTGVVELVDRLLHLLDLRLIVGGIFHPVREPFFVFFICLFRRLSLRSIGKQMAIGQRMLASSNKPVHFGSHFVQSMCIARESRIVSRRPLDVFQILAESLIVRSEMPSSMRARAEIGRQPLTGRQCHTISNRIVIETIGQELDDRMICKQLWQDVMNWKHTIATF